MERVTSKSLAGPSEICLYMPIRKGFADGLATRTYESRLRSFTKLFSDLRVIARESRTNRVFSDIVDRLNTIHGVTISIMNDHVLLTVHFDQPWEPYIHVVWRDLGFIFDAILSNCEGYLGEHNHAMGSEAFAGWIRKYQVDTNTFYMNSSHTTDDVAYLDQLERHTREAEVIKLEELAQFRPRTPQEIAQLSRNNPANTVDSIKLGVQAVYAFHALTAMYPKDSPDHCHILNAARSVLGNEFPKRKQWPLDKHPELGALIKLFHVELDWFENFVVDDKVRPQPSLPKHNPRIVQGGILKKYDANLGVTALLQIKDPAAAREYLGHLTKHITTGVNPRTDIYVNVSFTAHGLERLGVPEHILNLFPRPFLEGMAARAGLLGDMQQNHPDQWRLPPRNWVKSRIVDTDDSTPRVNIASVDLVLQIRRQSNSPGPKVPHQDPLLQKLRELQRLGNKAVLITSVQETYARRKPGVKLGFEHFGFSDGWSQPKPSNTSKDFDAVPIGDVCLGSPRGTNSPIAPHWGEPLFRDGSFLVMRKLSQDVGGLRSTIAANLPGNPTDEQVDELLALLMGRRQDGVPLIDTNIDPNKTNAFTYKNDPDGIKVPHYAHIRRTNPRFKHHKNRDIAAGEVAPRIVRRGMSFGPDYDPKNKTSHKAERGLLFQCYNTDLPEQFETIQRWIAGDNKTAPYSKLSDPFMGVPKIEEDRVLRLSDGTQLNLGRKPFVTLDWGAYLFVPSLNGLKQLAKIKPEPTRNYAADGARIIHELQQLESISPSQAHARWKRLLEEKESKDAEDHKAVWAAVRQLHQGTLRTPFGVLVGTNKLIDTVLANSELFSVCEYDKRLRQGIGKNYLGYDEPKHGKSADKPNEVFAQLTEASGFKAGYQAGVGLISQLGLPGLVSVPLPKYVDFGLGFVTQKVFGIPDGKHVQLGMEPAWDAEHFKQTKQSKQMDTVHCPYHIMSTSRAVFQPQPSDYVQNTANKHGQAFGKAIRAYSRSLKNPSPFQQSLRRASERGEFPDVLMGALLGFVPTAQGNFLDTCRDWLKSGHFWRVQNAYKDAQTRQSGKNKVNIAMVASKQSIYPELARTMAKRPVPSMVHRTATAPIRLGSTSIEAGEQVVIGLVSATAETQYTDVLPVFGGDYYAPTKPTHACPGRLFAMGTLQGLIAALYDAPGTLRPAPSPLALQFNAKPLQ
ncbi:MAG: hypothetical protein AAF541_06050 [Pseudomonadota bacterium]